MKKQITFLLTFFCVSNFYAMEKQGPTDGLHSRLRKMLDNVEQLSLNNKQLKQEIKRIERPKKRRCRLTKCRFFSMFEDTCVALCLTCVLDQLFMQSPLDVGL